MMQNSPLTIRLFMTHLFFIISYIPIFSICDLRLIKEIELFCYSYCIYYCFFSVVHYLYLLSFVTHIPLSLQ